MAKLSPIPDRIARERITSYLKKRGVTKFHSLKFKEQLFLALKPEAERGRLPVSRIYRKTCLDICTFIIREKFKATDIAKNRNLKVVIEEMAMDLLLKLKTYTAKHRKGASEITFLKKIAKGLISDYVKKNYRQVELDVEQEVKRYLGNFKKDNRGVFAEAGLSDKQVTDRLHEIAEEMIESIKNYYLKRKKRDIISLINGVAIQRLLANSFPGIAVRVKEAKPVRLPDLNGGLDTLVPDTGVTDNETEPLTETDGLNLLELHKHVYTNRILENEERRDQARIKSPEYQEDESDDFLGLSSLINYMSAAGHLENSLDENSDHTNFFNIRTRTTLPFSNMDQLPADYPDLIDNSLFAVPGFIRHFSLVRAEERYCMLMLLNELQIWMDNNASGSVANSLFPNGLLLVNHTERNHTHLSFHFDQSCCHSLLGQRLTETGENASETFIFLLTEPVIDETCFQDAGEIPLLVRLLESPFNEILIGSTYPVKGISGSGIRSLESGSISLPSSKFPVLRQYLESKNYACNEVNGLISYKLREGLSIRYFHPDIILELTAIFEDWMKADKIHLFPLNACSVQNNRTIL